MEGSAAGWDSVGEPSLISGVVAIFKFESVAVTSEVGEARPDATAGVATAGAASGNRSATLNFAGRCCALLITGGSSSWSIGMPSSGSKSSLICVRQQIGIR